jgi:TPR repeat protein
MKHFICALLLLCAAPAFAGPVEDLAAAAEAYSKSDFPEAARLFRKSAEQGNVTAQDSLGVLYVNGEGVPQDYVQAYAWFNIAETYVPANDDGWHARLNRFRNEIAGEMSAADMAAAQKLTRELMPKITGPAPSPGEPPAPRGAPSR